VALLGGRHFYSLRIASELSADLGATIVGIGESRDSPILQSRYCDEGVAIPLREAPIDAYRDRLREVLRQYEPDALVPVGYRSVVAVDGIRDQIPETVGTCLPPSESLEIALNKPDTKALADRLGVDTPETLARIPRESDPREASLDVDRLPYPVFLKAEDEAGVNQVARVDSPADLDGGFESLAEREDGGDIVVQEYVDGADTYGCGVLFVDGEPKLHCTHRETRSIPREGGTGTRVRIFEDERLTSLSTSLLRELDWEGIALVEFKRRPDGTYTLMEINPKFWASYPLASEYGYRFASAMVAACTGADVGAISTAGASTGEMTFPIREFYYALKHSEDPNESLLGSARAMFWPPARLDVDFTDPRGWFAPAGLATSARWAIDLWRGTDDPV
jgi:predicted ATP-grasp superfamily ATP-dependent carboligase